MITQTWHDETTNFSMQDYRELLDKFQSATANTITQISLNKKNIDSLKTTSVYREKILGFGMNEMFGVRLVESSVLQDNQFMYETEKEMILHTIGQGELRIPKYLFEKHPMVVVL